MAGARRVEWWSLYVAQCHAFLGDAGEALDWLENAVRLGYINYPFLSSGDVILARFRGQPRYDALIEKIRRAWERFPD